VAHSTIDHRAIEHRQDVLVTDNLGAFYQGFFLLTINNVSSDYTPQLGSGRTSCGMMGFAEETRR